MAMISARTISLTPARCRSFSSSARTRYDYRKPQAAQVQGRSILRVQGKDAAKFLKGLTCKDVDGLPGGGYSGFINPTVCLPVNGVVRADDALRMHCRDV